MSRRVIWLCLLCEVITIHPLETEAARASLSRPKSDFHNLLSAVISHVCPSVLHVYFGFPLDIDIENVL